MEGLQSGLIRIGTFSSVTCHRIPGLIKDFKELYPTVHFELQQGNYTEIPNWIKKGSLDFGFVNSNITDLSTIPLQEDQMVAVMPVDHPLASSTKVSLEDLLKDPYILLDEGVINEPLLIFKAVFAYFVAIYCYLPSSAVWLISPPDARFPRGGR
ncbi:LysR family transcriptional regulator substrate-binding protein [Peribacillus sp. NPDC058075]|uniref:LysR family transcriptional regulator substrate-binding protein n=1 Tax=unclassified Peribacillus TaxID=2675266 RepID=UPI0036DDEE27